MKVDFFHVADEAIISQEGKLSAVGIFDRIWTESVPAVHPRLALLARISSNVHEGSQHQLQVQFVDEDGTTDVRITLKDDGSRGLLPVCVKKTIAAIDAVTPEEESK